MNSFRNRTVLKCSGVGTVATVAAMAATLFYGSFFFFLNMYHNRSVKDWGQALT